MSDWGVEDIWHLGDLTRELFERETMTEVIVSCDSPEAAQFAPDLHPVKMSAST